MPFRKQNSNGLFWMVVGVAVLHHADHILRIDHSGWPFLSSVSPFTYSLLAYPILASIYRARNKPWYRVAATAFLFLFTAAAHIFFEPLSDKYHTWTYGSNRKYHVGEMNLLGVHSRWLGIASIAIAVLLSVALLLLLIAYIREAVQKQKGEVGT